MINYHGIRLCPEDAGTRLPNNWNYSMTVGDKTIEPLRREAIWNTLDRMNALYEPVILSRYQRILNQRKPRLTSTPRAERELVLGRAL
ncbi:MAG: hypothetical protein AABX54_01285 [Nanoarchaeota archaeon]